MDVYLSLMPTAELAAGAPLRRWRLSPPRPGGPERFRLRPPPPRLTGNPHVGTIRTVKSISKTFRLSEAAVRALAALVASGRAPNQTALLEDLLRREAVRLEMEHEEEKLDRAWREAMEDPAFLADVAAVEADFAALDAEVWKRS